MTFPPIDSHRPSYVNYINNVPNEILISILQFLPYNRDIKSCRLVCKKWKFIIGYPEIRSELKSSMSHFFTSMELLFDIVLTYGMVDKKSQEEGKNKCKESWKNIRLLLEKMEMLPHSKEVFSKGIGLIVKRLEALPDRIIDSKDKKNMLKAVSIAFTTKTLYLQTTPLLFIVNNPDKNKEGLGNFISVSLFPVLFNERKPSSAKLIQIKEELKSNLSELLAIVLPPFIRLSDQNNEFSHLIKKYLDFFKVSVTYRDFLSKTTELFNATIANGKL